MSSTNQIINKASSTACVSKEGAILQLLTGLDASKFAFLSRIQYRGEKMGKPP